MTENLSFFEDHSSNMPQIEYIDILAQPEWQNFRDEAARAEFDVSDYNPTDEASYEQASQRAEDLTETFGLEHKGMRTKVIGLGYGLNDIVNDSTDDEPILINTESASFHGVELCYRDGKWQAMLNFYCHEDTHDLPHGEYVIPPDAHHLMLLNIDMVADIDDEEEANEDIDVAELLCNDVESARVFAKSEDFTSATAEEQRMVLKDIITSIDSYLPRKYYDRDAVVNCSNYYTVLDDMPGFDVREFKTDLSDIQPEERTALKGYILGFDYPELQGLPDDTHLDASILNMNDMSYCFVLRNEEDRATHYILPQTITSII